MAFTKFTSDVENIQKLADRPQLEPKALKEVFDKAGEDIKLSLIHILLDRRGLQRLCVCIPRGVPEGNDYL